MSNWIIVVTVSVNLAVIEDKYCTLHGYGTRVKPSQVKIVANPVISGVYRLDKRICEPGWGAALTWGAD